MREEFLRKSEFQHLRKKCSHNQSMYLQKILEYAAKNISQQSQVANHPYLGISKKNFWLEFIADEKLQNTTDALLSRGHNFKEHKLYSVRAFLAFFGWKYNHLTKGFYFILSQFTRIQRNKVSGTLVPLDITAEDTVPLQPVTLG